MARVLMRYGEIEALLGKSTSSNVTMWGEPSRGGSVDVTMLSQPRLGYLTQGSSVVRQGSSVVGGQGSVHDRIRLETGVVPARGVQQVLGELISLQAVENNITVTLGTYYNYLGEGFQRWESCSVWSPTYGW